MTRSHLPLVSDSGVLRSAPIYNLPAQLTSLIGREQEVAAACSLLRQADIRLLTLIGTGGVGKTCLGLRIASDLHEDFADGICFVSLAPISDAELVIPTIAQTLGLREALDRPLIGLLIAHLSEKQVLLLLDNFEHVIGAIASVMELLGACPALKIIITSREVIRVRGEQEFPVRPLALPNLLQLPASVALSHYAAVSLFLQRARSVQPDFQLTAANASTIAAICTCLDGLPLALELAAARLKLLTPQALLARLEHRLVVLTQGGRDAPVRQQTLRNTLRWSYDLLDSQEQCLFCQLAVFVGGCTLEAVETIWQSSADESISALNGIASLLDKSLLQRWNPGGDEEPRFFMLETIREYGLEWLNSSEEMERTRLAHAHYYLRLAQEITPKLEEPEQTMWLERLEREHDNLRAAMRWSLEEGQGSQRTGTGREIALRLGIVLRPFWIMRGYIDEGRAFLERVLEASEETGTTVRAKALEAAASLAIFQNDHERGEMLCRESLELCRIHGDTEGSASALHLLGTLAWQRGDFAEAQSLMEEALALARKSKDNRFIASLLSYLAGQATQQSEYARAQTLLEESLALHRKQGNTRGMIYSLLALALTLFISQGDAATVNALLEESLALSRKLDEKAAIARCFSHAALVALQQGNAAAARQLAGDSVALHRETGDQWSIAWGDAIVAKAEACQGNDTAAWTLYEESLMIARKIGSKLIITVCLEGMASVQAARREPARAARLWGAAETLREMMAAPIWPVERASYERLLNATRDLLGEKTFALAWAEGRTMPLEQLLIVREPVTTSTTSSAGRLSKLPAKPSATSPAGLTRREIEVLGLLTMGLTNTQIARQLVISLPTVNTHVRSIYAKLDVTSRAAATRYAVEHHLV